MTASQGSGAAVPHAASRGARRFDRRTRCSGLCSRELGWTIDHGSRVRSSRADRLAQAVKRSAGLMAIGQAHAVRHTGVARVRCSLAWVVGRGFGVVEVAVAVVVPAEEFEVVEVGGAAVFPVPDVVCFAVAGWAVQPGSVQCRSRATSACQSLGRGCCGWCGRRR